MIELEDVRKVFNRGRPNEFTAVDGITLRIPAHSITVLKGPSGSGKTTLLGMIGCMLRPTSGRIRLSGLQLSWAAAGDHPERIDVSGLPERFLTDVRRRTFGFVFQQFNLIKGITAIENVMLPAYPCGEPLPSVRERAFSMLDLFNIRGKAATKTDHLSGGEAQRVTIARALINDPSVIIADEPTAHLDTRLSREFMDIILSLKRRGKTAIIASHDPLVFESDIADNVITIRDGRIEESSA